MSSGFPLCFLYNEVVSGQFAQYSWGNCPPLPRSPKAEALERLTCYPDHKVLWPSRNETRYQDCSFRSITGYSVSPHRLLYKSRELSCEGGQSRSAEVPREVLLMLESLIWKLPSAETSPKPSETCTFWKITPNVS